MNYVLQLTAKGFVSGFEMFFEMKCMGIIAKQLEIVDILWVRLECQRKRVEWTEGGLLFEHATRSLLSRYGICTVNVHFLFKTTFYFVI